MAEAPIPNPTWLALLRRLGIQRFGAWLLSDRVVPVALVDAGSVTLNASAVTPLFGTPASAGEVNNPAAGTRLADTAALAAGNWSIFIIVWGQNTADLRVRKRNATDAADVWSQRVAININDFYTFTGRFSFAASERLVVETVGAPLLLFQASIFAVQDV